MSTSKAGLYASAFAESVRERGLRGLAIGTGAAWARARHDLGVRDYFTFRVHERPLREWKDYRGFYNGPFDLLRAINGLAHQGGAHFDKIGETAALLAAGVPVLPIRAIVSRRALDCAFPVLRNEEAVIEHLAGERPLDLFVKPNDEIRGRGVFVVSVNEAGEVRVGGEKSTVQQVAERLLELERPMLVQNRRRTHRAMAPYGGDFGLSTIRVLTALTAGGPVLISAAQKVLGSPSLTDNFRGGLSGNMIVPIDLATGRYRAVLGRRNGNRFLIEASSDHSTLGTRIEGQAVPMFDEVRRVALALAEAFPDNPMLGSDVAVTEDGVVVVEVNREWGCAVPQVAGEQGILGILREWVPKLRLDERRRSAAMAQLDMEQGV